VEFRVLGPVEAWDGGRRLDIGPARQQAVLAVLLLDAGRVVAVDRLVGRVWGDDPPASARNALQGHVMRLRAALRTDPGAEARLALRAGGYVLEAVPEQVDVFEFRRLVAGAAAPAPDDQAAELLHGALGCWRGSALTGVASPWLDRMRDALELKRRTAVLDLNDIGLRQGRHGALTGELTELAEACPEDERLVGQLMLALYRSGRTADALWWFERTRRWLADELGADPEPRLRELHEKILRGDRSLDWSGPGGASDGQAGGGGVSPGWPGGSGGRLVPRELPGDVPTFTGRAAELAELHRLLADHAEGGEAGTVVVSAVAGTAGVGKTALAVRWAHQAADRFPDGQLYVNLRGYDPGQRADPADVLAGFLGSLGVAGQDIPAEPGRRAALYRSLLAGRRILVVLDNASDPEQVRPLLPGAAGCRVVVTSRDTLAGLVARDSAVRLDLDLLPMADAVALLRAVIGGRVDDEPQAAQTLAAQCARLPLALRVAAELAVAQPALPLAALTDELADEQGRLGLLAAGGDPRTAVPAVFSWSCRHLDPATVQGFGLLGLHPGPDLEPYAAAALAGVTLPQARRLLATLAAAHLTGPSPAGPGRAAMHDLLRAYARDVATGSGEQQAAMTRLMDHYLRTAAAAMNTLHPAFRHARPDVPAPSDPVPPVAEPDTARGWLDREMACLTAVTAHAAEHGWPGHAIRLARVLNRDLLSRGHALLVGTIHGHAVTAARTTGDRAAEATALRDLGSSEALLGRPADAAGHLQDALALAREAGHQALEITALGYLANVDISQGRFHEAISHIEQVLALDRETGSAAYQGLCMTSLGHISMLRGRYREGTEYLERGLAIDVRNGDRLGEAVTLGFLGYCETGLGSHRQAARHFARALAIARELGYRKPEAYALGGLGKVQSGLGHHRQAGRLLQQAVAMYRELGDWDSETEMLNYLGAALLTGGDPGQARSQFSAALVLASQIGAPYEQARAHSGLASCFHAAGDYDQARDHWEQALPVFTSSGAAEAGQVRASLAGMAAADVR
jgi:DNA-binding SARP family transcriptional activator/tetratricopeptide (TPR) repeat protein